MTAPDPSETNRSTRAFLFTPWIKESCEAFHTKHTQREALNGPRRGTLVRGPLIATSTNNPRMELLWRHVYTTYDGRQQQHCPL